MRFARGFSGVITVVMVVMYAAKASADPLSDDAPIPLKVDAQGTVRAVSGSGKSSCTGPCTLHVARGFVRLSTESASREIYVDRPSRVTVTHGTLGLGTTGAVLLLAGAAIAVVAVVVPLVFCRRGEIRTDPSGRQVQDPDPCASLGDEVKIAWIAGAGFGLAGAALGGILLATAGPKLRVDSDSSAWVWPRLVPWATSRPESNARAAGLSLVVSF